MASFTLATRLQRDAEQRQFFRIWLDPDLLRRAARDVGQSDAVDLYELRAQLVGELEQVLVRPAPGRLWLRRQCQYRHRDIIDATTDDQRFGDADWDAIDIGADLLMDAEDRILRLRSDQEPRGDHHAVVLGLAVDMLDAVDALDDRFQRLRDEFNCVGTAQAIGIDADIDHWHADLRLFLTRDHHDGDEADHERREQEQRCQRRGDRRLGKPARESEIHGRTNWSPARTPDRISSPSGSAGVGSSRPRCTGTSTTPPAF
ncbi:hypothetical protein ACVME8_000604 [Bradyrhizobium diazoefficiens]